MPRDVDVTRWNCLLLAGCVAVGCGETAAPRTHPVAPTGGEGPSPEPAAPQSEPAPEAAPKPEPDIEPAVVDPGVPTVDPAHRLQAPARYEKVQLRAGLPVQPRYANLRYEGNNKNFRGKLSEAGLYREGAATAADWRTWIAGTAGMVVLRDSLFSQQDHPYRQRGHALMMPPSWISVAVAEVQAGRKLVAMQLPSLDDDEAWTRFATVEALFGVYPGSEALFTHAVRAIDGAAPAGAEMTRNARESLLALAAQVKAMVDVQGHGASWVAKAGAAQIAASDRAYFGAELRAQKLIPIFVENPNEHEARDEGKGMQVWGRALPAAAVDLARRELYARRLQDGALGIERYDLRHPAERARAVTVLEELVPRGSTGHAVWLWVNGGSDGHGNGDPALPYIESFREQLAAADIEMSRVILLSKPSVRPWGDEAPAILEQALEQYGALDLVISAQLNTRAFAKLVR